MGIFDDPGIWPARKPARGSASAPAKRPAERASAIWPAIPSATSALRLARLMALAATADRTENCPRATFIWAPLSVAPPIASQLLRPPFKTLTIGGATESGAQIDVARGEFSVRSAVAANAINLASLRALVADGIAGQIAYARSAGRFAGTEAEPRAGLRAGHIPGSSNVPISSLLKDGALKDKDDLAVAFAVGGIDVTRPVITSCGSGVTACGLALALAILGNEKTFVYDGSWSEWGASDAPIETGSAA